MVQIPIFYKQNSEEIQKELSNVCIKATLTTYINIGFENCSQLIELKEF